MPTPTDDLVARLLAGTGGGKHWMDLHEEAAAEITRLRAEVEALRKDARCHYAVEIGLPEHACIGCAYDPDEITARAKEQTP